jgi:hypothetical protein
MIIGGLFAAAALAVLVGLAVQALWNALMPGIFGLPEVGYWQAVGLLVLGHLLFGGGFQHQKHISRKGRSNPCGDPEHENTPDA